MSGQMRKFDYKKYNNQLENMAGPVFASELPKVKLDLTGIREYAREKGVPVASLTEEEKQLFITRLQAVANKPFC